MLLKQKFDPSWFVPPDTYLANWFIKIKQYFPFGGDRVTLYCYGLDISRDFGALQNLVAQLQGQVDIIDNVDSWTQNFQEYANDHFMGIEEKLPGATMNESFFSEKLAQFLFSPKGGKYRGRFEFDDDDGELTCGSPAPKVLLSQINFVHKIFSGPEEHIPAMNRVKR